jgi:Family of unknown function (DUF6494)
MDEDQVNMEIRKFLKAVGISSQREMERALRGAMDAGTLSARDVLKSNITLRIPAIGFEHIVEGDIALSKG